jgi:hypothetical protein
MNKNHSLKMILRVMSHCTPKLEPNIAPNNELIFIPKVLHHKKEPSAKLIFQVYYGTVR